MQFEPDLSRNSIHMRVRPLPPCLYTTPHAHALIKSLVKATIAVICITLSHCQPFPPLRPPSKQAAPSNMPPPLRLPASLPASLRLQQTFLKYLIKSSDPFRQELLGQTLGAVTYPLLRRSLRRHTPTLPTLEHFLRPVLVPEEHAKGIECWYNNARFQAFLRKEYLQRVAAAEAVAGLGVRRAKTVGKEKSPAAGADAADAAAPPSTPPSPPPWATDVIIDKDGLKATRLPTHQELIDFFHLHDWNRRPGPRSAALEGAKRQSLFRKLKEEGPDVSTWSLNDVLEVGGACVEGRGRFNVFCEEAGLWEVWTKEYIDALASYLTTRARELQSKGASSLPSSPSSPPSPIIVLELGAGTGTLAYHLKQRLDPSLLTYIATDIEPTPTPLPPSSPPCLLPSLLAHPFVEELSWEKALYRHPEAAIVVCAWMPMGEDWTEGMRKGGREGGRVQEYILIGEHGEQAGCGDPVKTWGASTYRKGGAEGEKEGGAELLTYKQKECFHIYLSSFPFLPPSLPPSLRHPSQQSQALGSGWLHRTRRR